MAGGVGCAGLSKALAGGMYAGCLARSNVLDSAANFLPACVSNPACMPAGELDGAGEC